jgi:hypothetical protein
MRLRIFSESRAGCDRGRTIVLAPETGMSELEDMPRDDWEDAGVDVGSIPVYPV